MIKKYLNERILAIIFLAFLSCETSKAEEYNICNWIVDDAYADVLKEYPKEKKLTGKFSAFTIAGGSIGVTNEKFKKWHSTFWENLEPSINLLKVVN